MSKIITLLLFSLFLLGHGDTIVLKNGEMIQGQLIKVSGTMIIVEKFSRDISHIVNVSIPAADVEKIIDESGFLLFSQNKLQASSLIPYYHSPLRAEQYSFPAHRLPSFPQLVFELGYNGSITHLDDLEKITREFLVRQGIEEPVYLSNVPSTYSGIQIGLYLRITRNFSIGGTGHINRYDQGHFRIFFGELRYRKELEFVSPWIGVGYASQSIEVNQTPGPNVNWMVSSDGPLFSLGIDFGRQVGWGFYTAVRYLPFSKKITVLSSYPGLQLTDYRLAKIDLSVVMVSLGTRFNF